MTKLFDDLVDISFATTATVTPRTAIVAEAFGLGIDEEKVFYVFEKTPLTLCEGDVVYITGDSGGGKSCLLKYLQEQIGLHRVANAQWDQSLNEEVLVEGVGNSIDEALKILTQVGLGDAFLMLRRVKELSDGQKYRYILAKLINSQASVWCVDEFCATLDRPLAKVIAYSFQKAARELGKTVIVATTHEDLYEDLNPSLVVRKCFGGRVQVTRTPYNKRACSLLSQVSYRLGTYKEYQESGLAFFHYKNDKRPAGLLNVYFATIGTDIVGSLLTRYPALEIRERNVVTSGRYTKHYKRLNEEVEMISRVVVHSKYRGIGLGRLLVKNYLASEHSKSIVETMAVMARYNPFFEKAGMTRVTLTAEQRKLPTSYIKLQETLKLLAFDLNLISSIKYNLDKLKTLSTEQIQNLLPILMKENMRVQRLYDVDNKDRLSKVKAECDAATENDMLFLAEAIKRTKKPELAYYIWYNPKNYAIPLGTHPLSGKRTEDRHQKVSQTAA